MEEQEKKQSDSVSLEEVISTLGKLAKTVEKIGEQQEKFSEGFSEYRKTVNKDLASLRRDAEKKQSDSVKDDNENDDKLEKIEKAKKAEKSDEESKLEQYRKNLRLAEKLRIAEAKDDVMKIKGVLLPKDEIEIYKIAKKADTDEEFEEYMQGYLTTVREEAKIERQKKKEEAEKLLAEEKQKDEEKQKIEQAGKLKDSPNPDKTSITSQQSPKYQELIKRRQILITEGKQNTPEYKDIHYQLTNAAFPEFGQPKEKQE
jgi:hypothetical protein